MTDTLQQIENRIAMWTAELIKPTELPPLGPTAQDLVRSLVADTRAAEQARIADAILTVGPTVAPGALAWAAFVRRGASKPAGRHVP
jgi:hypothetical protein